MFFPTSPDSLIAYSYTCDCTKEVQRSRVISYTSGPDPSCWERQLISFVWGSSCLIPNRKKGMLDFSMPNPWFLQKITWCQRFLAAANSPLPTVIKLTCILAQVSVHGESGQISYRSIEHLKCLAGFIFFLVCFTCLFISVV